MDTGLMRCVRIVTPALCVVLAGCTSSGSTSAPPRPPAGSTAPAPTTTTSPPPPARHLAAAWPAYHGDNTRTGFTSRRALSGPLRRAWTRPLDGAVYAQPIVVGDTVIATTEGNSVYALRINDGTVVWRRHFRDPVPLG